MPDEEEEMTLKDSFLELEEVCGYTVDLFNATFMKVIKLFPNRQEAIEITKQLCPKPMEVVAWLLSEEDVYEFPDEEFDAEDLDDELLKDWTGGEEDANE